MALRDDILGFLDWLVLRDEQNPFGSEEIPELEAIIYLSSNDRRKAFEKLVDLHLRGKEERINSILRP